MTNTVARALAVALDAWQRCAQQADHPWTPIWRERIESLVKDRLPSGSGWDSGTTFDFDKSTPEKLVFHGAFHHMDEGGGYDGWTEHTITVRPSLAQDFTLTISGRDRDQVKDYLHEMFSTALAELAPEPLA